MGIANWTTIENTLQAQFVAACGLTGDRVRWGHQSRDSVQSAGDFALLEMFRFLTVGSPEDSVIDNPTPGAGTEILIRSQAQTEFEVRFSIFTMTPTGSNSAGARAINVRHYLERDDVLENLQAAGIALVNVEDVQRIPAVLETEFQDRAVFVARFRTLDGSSYATTYIESAEWFGTYN